MNERPLVSVVIPAYNAVEFVEDAIDSVLAQTYDNLECIVVDDGSHDGTPEVLHRRGRECRVVRQRNQGVAAARNRGAEEARGELVALLDADDVWLPNKLERQVLQFLEEPQIAISFTGYQVVDSELNCLRQVGIPPPHDVLRNLVALQSPGVFVPSTYVIRRAVYMKSGGFDESLSTSADLDFAIRTLSRYPFRGLAKPLAKYRQHGGQMHRRTGLTEREMVAVLAKAFDDQNLPTDVRALRSTAAANLGIMLCAGYWAESQSWTALRWLLSSVKADPWTVLRRVVKRAAGR